MGVAQISFDLNEPPAITFAPNMTEATFQNQEEPESIEPDLLFPPVENEFGDSDLLGIAKHHGKKKDKDHIPRPPNAFILFRSSFIKQQELTMGNFNHPTNNHIPGSIEGNHSQLSKIVGACWQRLSFEERQVWERKAKQARAEHKRLYPDYRFVRSRTTKATPKDKPPPKFVNTIAVPQSSASGEAKAPKLKTVVTSVSTSSAQTGSKSSRRRNVTSKTAEDPRRCEQIARLLVAGHKGSSLEAMVQKFDAESAKSKESVDVTITEIQTPERIANGSLGRISAIRRTSSCPPLDIQAATVASFDSPKSSQAPSRRQKALRGATTGMPYPQSPYTKLSRSVSPPVSPSERGTFEVTPRTSPVEGPFVGSAFTFGSPTAMRHSPVEGIAPHDVSYCDMPSPSPTVTHAYYQWPTDSPSPSPVQGNETYYQNFTGAPLQMHPLSAVSSSSDLSSTFSGAMDESWNWTSEFEWIPGTGPLEDETGSSSAPPSTPDRSSPVLSFSRHLPLEEYPNSYSDVEAMPEPAVDLSNYGKGLRLVASQPMFALPESIGSPDSDVYSPHYQLPQVNISHLAQGNTNTIWPVAHFDETSQVQGGLNLRTYEF